ncbi:unnamed protein product [Scytosiphon promiscuus]
MERAKFARVDTLAAALSCPLCFETVKDCVVTPCGHSFCRRCAGDAVTRKHCCPVCQVGVIGGEAGLIRNFLVDEVTSTLQKATEETDVAYMRLLFENAVDAGAGAGAASATGNGSGDDIDTRLGSVSSSPADRFPRPRPHSEVGGATGKFSGDPMEVEEQQRDVGLAQPGRQQRQRQCLGLSGRPAPSLDLSPVEAVLVKRMREAFLGYQAYYARERAEHEAEVKDLTVQLQAAKGEIADGPVSGGAPWLATVGPGTAAQTSASKVAALRGAIRDSEARFKVGMVALLQDFDAHAAAALPPPSLLPSTVTVIVASRGIRFDTQLLPTHFPENIYSKVRAYYASSGDEVLGFGQNIRLYLQPLSSTAANAAGPAGTGTPTVTGAADGPMAAQGQMLAQGPLRRDVRTQPIADATQTVFSQCPGGRISAGWALVVAGTVVLASEEVKPCFAVEFAKRKRGSSVNGSGCKLNWLCASCATHCHGGCRDVKPFMLNHLPTWACCYCSKKRSPLGCKLVSAGENINAGHQA